MSKAELEGVTVFKVMSEPYTREDLMEMDPTCLRALLRERTHHSIECELYPILLGRKELPKSFGLQVELILDVWQERGLTMEGDDLDWVMENVQAARTLRSGGKPELACDLPAPFDEQEMQVVKKLIWERRSIRDWVQGKQVPEEMITKVLEAGRAAPTGCNLSPVRFVVIRDVKEAKMVWSDIPTPMDSCVLIVICYDERIYSTVAHDKLVKHNLMLDCAAAGDHMLLMAHAIGLGGVWLSCTEKTANNFQTKYGLPPYIKQCMHVAIGWTAVGSIKSKRLPLEEMVIAGAGS
ncbi:MAG: nitroreductase family protein [Desulfarculaceae bacterium]|nr:nitroreductase family protein [Desulfarculaceae bacterium]MCF8071184.1 nitroreductase family protein [Desulfarculaceae bacterium]MCF8101213.1 nitroreductase family protein [Desulfarculaceae bacterium]MCF8115238.1 nitroreductase family protein [Desulfarculaceae bacterium]